MATEAVAEHTFAMMLNFSKRIHFAYQDLYLHDGKMTTKVANELKGKTLGIIGLGDIGSRVAEIGKCIGMNVLAWNKTKKQTNVAKLVDLDYLLKNSDFISLHLSVSEQTKNYLDNNKIKLMKPSAFVFNLADKTLVNNDDIYNALLKKKVAGYCVELWNINETKEHPLYRLDNVTAFHGFGWYTAESLERTFNCWLSNVKSYLDGKIVNKVA